MLRQRTTRTKKRRAWDLPANALAHDLRDFLDWSAAMGFAQPTLTQRLRGLRRFILWCAERAIERPQDVTLPIIERYQRHLHHYRKKSGEPLTFASQHGELVPLKAYFKWLVRERRILYNPASDMVMPRLPKRLPHHVLTIEEIEHILNQADVTTLSGIRDRAMMEVLYSSGIRRIELKRLHMVEVDTRRGSLLVKGGKGDKDRFVPLGERACAWVDKYLNEVRPELIAMRDDGTLFLADYGEPFHPDTLGDCIKRYIEQAGIKVQGSCHLFRHACATHMLENGADIRFIQALLGHAKLTTTEVYTQVSILKLKEIHAATHPARLTRVKDDQSALLGDEEKQALLDTLADEDDEEVS